MLCPDLLLFKPGVSPLSLFHFCYLPRKAAACWTFVSICCVLAITQAWAKLKSYIGITTVRGVKEPHPDWQSYADKAPM